MDADTRQSIENSTLLFIASRNVEGAMDVSLSGAVFAMQPDQPTFERLLSNAATTSWMITWIMPSMTVFAAEALPEIKAPVLMLYGEKDALVTVRPSLDRAKALNPAIRSQIYADSGHAPFLEEAQRFNRDLVDFREVISTR